MPQPTPRPVRPFTVVATVTRQVSFLVDARTSEEAESVVEDWIEDGESGTVVEQEVVFEEVYPSEDSELEPPINRSKFPRTLETLYD